MMHEEVTEVAYRFASDTDMWEEEAGIEPTTFQL